MNFKKTENDFDSDVQQIIDILDEYKQNHPNAQINVQQKYWYSIRIRIIDPDFRGLNRVEREVELWPILHKLPEEVFLNLTMLLLLTPEETGTSLANMEFENPIPSPDWLLSPA